MNKSQTFLPKNGQKRLCPYADTCLQTGMKFRQDCWASLSEKPMNTGGTMGHPTPSSGLCHRDPVGEWHSPCKSHGPKGCGVARHRTVWEGAALQGLLLLEFWEAIIKAGDKQTVCRGRTALQIALCMHHNTGEHRSPLDTYQSCITKIYIYIYVYLSPKSTKSSEWHYS